MGVTAPVGCVADGSRRRWSTAGTTTVRHHRNDLSDVSRHGQRPGTAVVDGRNARQCGGQPPPDHRRAG